MNPVRVGYAMKKIGETFNTGTENLKVLEVGCGGGILLEEFAERGFRATGIDPSGLSLKTAAEHSMNKKLDIRYVKGFGEDLPFPAGSFDIVLCCDVLEHVRDLPKVISEISRVLKKDGILIYDTFNRTFFSKIGAIKVLQEWKRWSIMPADLHVWEMFIRPGEIISLLRSNNLMWKEHKGIKPDISYIRMLHYLRLRALGYLNYEEFGEKFHMVEGNNTSAMYIGYALKTK